MSVIIPTRNRADSLQLTLESLQSQTLSADSFEVLIIDNGSTDNTKQVALSFQQKLGNIRYFFDPTPGLHVGRHLGMKMAESEILVYADDDIEAFPSWLEAVGKSFQDPEVALVGGKNLPKFESKPPEWISKMWEKSHNGKKIIYPLSIIDLGNDYMDISPFLVFGCNFSVRKSLLLKAGGFHPDSFPPELIRYRGDGESQVSKYIMSHNYRTIYNPDASVFHIVPNLRMTEEYFCQRFFQQGISDSYVNIRINKNALCAMMLKRLILKHIPFLTRNVISRKHLICYWQGYDFHQKEVRDDPELYKWIMKDNYL